MKKQLLLLSLLFPGVVLAKKGIGLDFSLLSGGFPLIPFEGTYEIYREDNLFHATCSILELGLHIQDWKFGTSVLRRFEMGLWYDVPFKGFLFPLVIEREFPSLKNYGLYIHLELPVIGIYLESRGGNMDNAILFLTGIRRKIFWTRIGIGARLVYLLSSSTEKDWHSGRWWLSIDLTYDIGVFNIFKGGG